MKTTHTSTPTNDSHAVIKPIETQYKGYRFRSRLEARWAVFFDALGLKWEYEPEGFDLGPAGWYLPDFWLPEIGAWFEVKPKFPSADEQAKAVALVLGNKNALLFSEGGPDWRCRFFVPMLAADGSGLHCVSGMCLIHWNSILHGKPALMVTPVRQENPPKGYAICAEDSRMTIGILPQKRFDELYRNDRYHDEIVKARSARFEFGESGARA